jgi:hypothetical protein
LGRTFGRNAHIRYDAAGDAPLKPVTSDPATTPAANQNRSVETPTAEENARPDHEADQDFEHGRGIALKDAVAWVRSWFTPHELPKPKSRKIS